MKLKHHPIFWMIISTIIIGTHGVSAKLALEGFEPYMFAGLRFVIIAITVALLTMHLEHKELNRKVWRDLLIGSAIVCAAAIFMTLGLKNTQAINFSLLTLLTPVFIYIGSIVFSKESFKVQALIGCAISLFGGFLLVGGPALIDGGSHHFNRGDAYVFISSMLMAANILHTKRLYSSLTPHQILAYRSLICGMIILGISVALAEPLNISDINLKVVAALLYNAGLVGGIALVVFYSALQYVKAEDTASLFYLEPLMGVLASSIILAERLNDGALVAGSVIVLGVIVSHPAQMHRFHFYHVPHLEHKGVLHQLMAIGRKLAGKAP